MGTDHENLDSFDPTPSRYSEPWSQQLCDIRHESVDKEIRAISEKIDAHRQETDKELRALIDRIDHLKDAEKEESQEIKEALAALRVDLKKDIFSHYKNLRDKIVISNRSAGEKLDSLAEFDEKLKGNGTPGIWEVVRSLTTKIRIMGTIIFIMAVMAVLGDYKNLTWRKIGEYLFGKSAKTEQVDTVEPSNTDPKIIIEEQEG